MPNLAPLRRFQDVSCPGQGPLTAPVARSQAQRRAASLADSLVPTQLRPSANAGADTPLGPMTGAQGVADDQPKAAGPRILIVDDNDDNRYTLTLYLELEGYSDFVTAQDGEEAIACLQEGDFDLVLLDVMMPKVDGYQVLAWVKDQARLRGLPVIMISALNEMSSVVRCIELGAVDYLLKPFNPVLLKARLGSTLEKKRLRDEIDAHLARLEQELGAARRLQMAMVPQSFPTPSAAFPLDLRASMEPAREVGGDLYDFFVTEDGVLSFLVGDVSGKGMPAALFMFAVRSLARHLALAGTTPAETLKQVNRALARDNPSALFVTLLHGVLNRDTFEMKISTAGHCLPLLRHADGTLRQLDMPRGRFLGFEGNLELAEIRHVLAPGESLIAYSDGCTETFANGGKEMFGLDGLRQALQQEFTLPVETWATRVKDRIVRFGGGTEPQDDLTLLIIHRKP
jgi:sigma-B regulation protein RsbU (phosphoserine phosphatase)